MNNPLSRTFTLLIASAMFLGTILFGVGSAFGQARMEVEAFSGAPFGVGRITLRSGGDFRLELPRRRAPGGRGGRVVDLAKKVAGTLGVDQGGSDLESAEMTVLEKAGRVYYPVFERRERPILRQFIAVPSEATILFLFQGDGPLDLSVFTPARVDGPLTPRQDAAGFDRLLRAWWTDYSAAAVADRKLPYPAMVEEYLINTLGRRLRLDLPQRPQQESSLFQSELNLLTASETARLKMARSILSGSLANQTASDVLPEELPGPKPELLNPPAEVPIEPIAKRVPIECLYVRFGSFPNFLWMRHRMEEWGGELRDIISERGLDYRLNNRMQQQLGLRESALAEVLGDKVISDVAMIGTDVFLSEGAAIGMLFQAKNSTALSVDLMQQRQAALKQHKDGLQERFMINGKAVSFFYTPENTLRSFYVVDGDFHLVTTSRAMVEWFLATGAGKHDSLGDSDSFRAARRRMPLSRNDTVFVYLSPEFFQNVFNPRYQIELNRRLRSVVEIELFGIAQLAARGEKKPADTIERLIAVDMLPPGFGQRPDGSRLVVVDGKASDSVRGGRGTFTPIPDVELGKVTPQETAEYARFAEEYTAQWGPMDPVVACVQRQTLPTPGLEKVVVDVQAAPLSQQHVQTLAQWLGEPTDQRLAKVPGDVVAFEAILRGGTFFSGGEHHLFGALRNADPAVALDPTSGLLARIVANQLNGLNGYVGAWPNAGFLQFISGLLESQPDAGGYSRLLGGLWKRQVDEFTLMSFHPEILEQITPQLKFEKAPRPAQVWFRADDLANSKLAPLLNAFGYRQSRAITLANTRYMNMLAEQLHVPLVDCRSTAEQLLAAKVVSPLGGDYEVRELDGGFKTWIATPLGEYSDPKQVPPDYRLPALNWLRQIEFEVSTADAMLAVHGEVVMPVETRPAAAPAFKLPGFGGSKPKEPTDKLNAKDSQKGTSAGPKPTSPQPTSQKPPSPKSQSPEPIAPPVPSPSLKSLLQRPPAPAPKDVKPSGRREF